MLKFLRLTHLYLGLFIAPSLIFFAFTGAMQTFGLHETSPGSNYKPAKWEVELATLHKKQTLALPVRRQSPAPDSAKPAAAKAGGSSSEAAPAVTAAPAFGSGTTPTPAPSKHMAMKYFFALVAWSLFISTLTGIYMAYKYRRDRWMMSGLLLAGIVVPLVLLRF